jgi:uncharacterized membrane protein YozB (DUF420 family)
MPAPDTPRLRLGPPGVFAWFAIAMVAAGVFWVVAALPYLHPSGQTLHKYPGMEHLDRRWGMILHVVGGTLALFTGPALIWLGETRQWLSLHRRLGFVYLIGAAITCLAAFYLSFTTPVGLLFASGLFGMALACTLATSLAFLAIQRRNIPQHREWMIRSCVTVFAFVFFRFIFAVLEAMGVGVPDASSPGRSRCWSPRCCCSGRRSRAQRVPPTRPEPDCRAPGARRCADRTNGHRPARQGTGPVPTGLSADALRWSRWA